MAAPGEMFIDAEKAHEVSPPSSQPASLHRIDTFDPQFEVSFTGDDDPRSPRSMSNLRKWIIVIIVSTTSLCVACTSSIYTQTYAQIESYFGISEIVAILGLTLFAVGLGLSPMILAPLSEVLVFVVLEDLSLTQYSSMAGSQSISDR